MDQELQKLIFFFCEGLPTREVDIYNSFDLKRFARVIHCAWKHKIGFHPDMFKNALKEVEVFQPLSDEELTAKSMKLCEQADFAKSMYQLIRDEEITSTK
ncbi:MAG: hypothetical protein ACI4AM_09580 [Muribaculaceae bacterium]